MASRATVTAAPIPAMMGPIIARSGGGAAVNRTLKAEDDGPDSWPEVP